MYAHKFERWVIGPTIGDENVSKSATKWYFLSNKTLSGIIKTYKFRYQDYGTYYRKQSCNSARFVIDYKETFFDVNQKFLSDFVFSNEMCLLGKKYK